MTSKTSSLDKGSSPPPHLIRSAGVVTSSEDEGPEGLLGIRSTLANDRRGRGGRNQSVLTHPNARHADFRRKFQDVSRRFKPGDRVAGVARPERFSQCPAQGGAKRGEGGEGGSCLRGVLFIESETKAMRMCQRANESSAILRKRVLYGATLPPRPPPDKSIFHGVIHPKKHDCRTTFNTEVH